MNRPVTRRQFLQRAALGAVLTGGGALPEPSLQAVANPAAKLAVAVIGCGGRGETALLAALGEHLVALVDVEDARLAAAARIAARQDARPKTFFDYRRMFDAMHRELDAVFIATPDHHHAPAAMRAMQLGKHVFCEKPLCHDIAEARALAAAAKKYKVVTQMGNQGHCAEGYRRVCEFIWTGAIGQVAETHSWNGFVNGGSGGRPPGKPAPAGLHWEQWLGPAPYRDYHEGLHPLYWRYWWDFGTGALGDWGCHNLDGVFWALKLGAPESVECVRAFGGSDEKYPEASVLRWDFPAREGMPALQAFWYDGTIPGPDRAGHDAQRVPNRPPLAAELERKHGEEFDHSYAGGGTIYVGDKGLLYSGNHGNRPRVLGREVSPPPVQLPRIESSHFTHFLNCCKTNKATCADFQYAAALTEFLLLGHLAIKAGVGQKVRWDAPGMRCPNRPELAQWIQRPHRKGWEV